MDVRSAHQETTPLVPYRLCFQCRTEISVAGAGLYLTVDTRVLLKVLAEPNSWCVSPLRYPLLTWRQLRLSVPVPYMLCRQCHFALSVPESTDAAATGWLSLQGRQSCLCTSVRGSENCAADVATEVRSTHREKPLPVPGRLSRQCCCCENDREVHGRRCDRLVVDTGLYLGSTIVCVCVRVSGELVHVSAVVHPTPLEATPLVPCKLCHQCRCCNDGAGEHGRRCDRVVVSTG